jgi:hypothetical protein
MPIARARSSPSKMLVMIDNVVGKIAAAPRPMRARKPMSAVALDENAANAEPTPNTARPETSASRRPYLSPRLPATSRSDAKVRV